MLLIGAGLLLFAGMSSVHAATYIINASIVTQTTGFIPAGTLTGGDTLEIPSGWTNHLYFLDVVGSSGNPIIITNPADAKISITETMTAAPSGSISFARCRYIVLDGSNYASETYGINLSNGIYGIRLYESEDIKIKYVEIRDTNTGAGIQWQKGTWTASQDVENIIVHNCYIHDAKTEGIYLGTSNFIPANHPSFKDCKIYSNIVENCGWDCIQLCAADQGTNEIYKNYCKNCGMLGTVQHFFGIFLDDYVTADVYQNMVINAYADGIIAILKVLQVDIHDNVIIDAGRHGLNNLSSTSGQTIINNTIVNSASDHYGINTKISDLGEIRYNLVVGTSTAGQISTGYSVVQDNLTSNSVANMYFVNADAENFRLTLNSSARDYSSNPGYSGTDYDNNPRPFGTRADAGAHEYPPSALSPADLNQDGRTDIQDIQLCVNVILETETDPDIVARADVNRDGSVNVLDIREIVNVILG